MAIYENEEYEIISVMLSYLNNLANDTKTGIFNGADIYLQVKPVLNYPTLTIFSISKQVTESDFTDLQSFITNVVPSIDDFVAGYKNPNNSGKDYIEFVPAYFSPVSLSVADVD